MGVFTEPGIAKSRIKEAVIKSAASAASLGFAGERQDDGPGIWTTTTPLEKKWTFRGLHFCPKGQI